jgi:hypothetical protein
MWTQEKWSQIRFNKKWFEVVLSKRDMEVHGWSNRMPHVSRPDGYPVDWDEVEKVAVELWQKGNRETIEEVKPVVETKAPASQTIQKSPTPLPEPQPEPQEKPKQEPQPVKKKAKRGRPKGSKNKPKKK